MNMPTFAADASLYRSGGRYRVTAGGSDSSDTQVTLAYMPTWETQRGCSKCLEGCAKNLAICSAIATAPLAGCIFPPACPFAAAAAGAALGACNTTSLGCIAECTLGSDCCPKACSVPNPFDAGAGCCDANERCVDEHDPNARRGCCPADQTVCAGRCCPKGHSCCGDTCCPPDYHCLDGSFCSQYPGRSLWPDDWKPVEPPPRVFNYCRAGYSPCGSTCCPPGLECCSIGGGHVACMTTCVH